MTCTSVEAQAAFLDVWLVARVYGTDMELRLRPESAVRRDDLGVTMSRSKDPGLSVRAMPVDRSPSKRALEKAGLRDDAEVSVYVPMKYLTDAGVVDLERLGQTFGSIDVTRATAVLDGTEWRVTDKGMPSRVGEIPLYLTLGLRRT